jgi:DNA mismatch repair protein MutL
MLVDLGTREQRLELPPPYVPPSEAIAEFRREPEEPSSKTFQLTGFVSRPQVQKGNRNSIFIFVNRRLIRDRLLLHSISSAYYNLMPPPHIPSRCFFSNAIATRWT